MGVIMSMCKGGKMKYLRYVFPLIVATVILGKEFYFDYRQEKNREQLKEMFHELLFDGDVRTNVRSVSLTDELVSITVNIQKTLVSDEIKSKFQRNAHDQLPSKICGSIGLMEMMKNGTRVSIDVIANSNVPITNVRVTREDCT